MVVVDEKNFFGQPVKSYIWTYYDNIRKVEEMFFIIEEAKETVLDFSQWVF